MLAKVGDNPPGDKPPGDNPWRKPSSESIFYWLFYIFWLLLSVWIFDVILHRLYDWLCC